MCLAVKQGVHGRVYIYVNLIFFNWLTAVIIIAASVVLIGLATVIPLRKIVKMRPIDAIRNV